jgi:hypothetical protein
MVHDPVVGRCSWSWTRVTPYLTLLHFLVFAPTDFPSVNAINTRIGSSQPRALEVIGQICNTGGVALARSSELTVVPDYVG